MKPRTAYTPGSRLGHVIVKPGANPSPAEVAAEAAKNRKALLETGNALSKAIAQGRVKGWSELGVASGIELRGDCAWCKVDAVRLFRLSVFEPSGPPLIRGPLAGHRLGQVREIVPPVCARCAGSVMLRARGMHPDQTRSTP